MAVSPLVVRLPLPDRRLSPNARVHWNPKREAVRAAKAMAYYLTIHEMSQARNTWPWPTAKLALTFTLPDNRRRDLDNLIAGCKAYFDGVADALGVDDSRFDIVRITRTVEKGKGEVRLEIEA